MKRKNSLPKYLLYTICSVAAVLAATFYFHISDTKQNTTTVIIERHDDDLTTEVSEIQTIKTTSKKTRTPKTTTTKASKAAETNTAEPTTEFVFIDLNSAGADEFAKLKGIGAVLADEIIRYRNEHGGFRNIEEIMNVKGIGEGIFADIEDNIYVIDPIYDTEEEFAPDDNYEEQENETEADEPTLTLEEAAPININTADAAALMLLPNINEEKAQSIIAFRDENGSFHNTYELLLVEGISRNDVNEILEFVTTD